MATKKLRCCGRNCDGRVTKEKLETTPLRIRNKFYVAHPKVSRPGDTWAKATLADAVAHARKLLDQDATAEYQLVVKVVRVVRRQMTPIIVEKV